MKNWLHKIEVFVDKIIPLLLLILLIIIIGEFAYHDFMVKHYLAVEIIDGFIIFVFILDLIFKYIRIKNIPKFLRASWIDIIAVFPFFLVFRLLEGFLGVFAAGETVTSAQKIVHVGVELEKEIGMTIKEGERAAKEAGRSEKLIRFLRPVFRSIRFSKFGNPEVRKETEKQAEEVVKETKKGVKIAEKAAEDIEKDTKEVIKGVEKVPRHVKAAIFYEKPKIMKYINDKINKLNRKIE